MDERYHIALRAPAARAHSARHCVLSHAHVDDAHTAPVGPERVPVWQRPSHQPQLGSRVHAPQSRAAAHGLLGVTVVGAPRVYSASVDSTHDRAAPSEAHESHAIPRRQ